MPHRFGYLFSILLLNLSASFAQSDSRDSSQAATSGIYPLPILFYTPETGIAGGAAAMYLYRHPDATRASTITGDIIYTEKKQIIVELDGDMYFDGGTSRLLSYLKFQKYPNKFFGIGNDTPEANEESYTSQTYYLSAAFTRNVYSRINFGPTIQIEDVTMKETDPSGSLARLTVPGSVGGTLCGIGVVANWDSRDNTIAAESGSFYQLTTLIYPKSFAGDFDFTDIQIDARKFFEVAPDQILALQAAVEFIKGTAPFWRMAKFGGQDLLRGYFDGRFRDNHCVALQAEYRVPVWWRFGAAGFVGAAQVSDRLSHLALRKFWLAGGVGVRFAWSPEERVNLRLDYGWGNNSSGLYITVTEAF